MGGERLAEQRKLDDAAVGVVRRALARAVEVTAMHRRGASEVDARASREGRYGGDLDHLADALNERLDRANRLTSRWRQAFADIVHDLRRPHVRHNERIAHILDGSPFLDAHGDVRPEARGRIFRRFTRLDASRTAPGAGLGLASAIAQAYRGRLYAEDAAPGLRVVADFTPAPHTPRQP